MLEDENEPPVPSRQLTRNLYITPSPFHLAPLCGLTLAKGKMPSRAMGGVREEEDLFFSLF